MAARLSKFLRPSRPPARGDRAESARRRPSSLPRPAARAVEVTPDPAAIAAALGQAQRPKHHWPAPGRAADVGRASMIDTPTAAAPAPAAATSESTGPSRGSTTAPAVAATKRASVGPAGPDRAAPFAFSHSLGKEGEGPELNFDAVGHRFGVGRKGDRARLVLGDGTTTDSVAPGDWAAHLVAALLDRDQVAPGALAPHLDGLLQEEGSAFQATVGIAEDDPLAFLFAGQTSFGPSCATVVGLEVGRTTSKGNAAFLAFACGDANLFQIRGDELVRAPFPVADPEAFHNTPPLVRSTDEGAPWQTLRGFAKEGDAFVVMSDALAEYCMRRADAGRPVWGLLPLLRKPAIFEAFVKMARNDKSGVRLKNDDSTIGVLTVPPRPEGEA